MEDFIQDSLERAIDYYGFREFEKHQQHSKGVVIKQKQNISIDGKRIENKPVTNKRKTVKSR